MGSLRQIMQKKTQSSSGRLFCVMTAMIGSCLLFYGYGREAFMEDMVSGENMVQASEEVGAEWDNDQGEGSIREKTEPSEENGAGALEIPLLEQLFTYEEVKNSSEQYMKYMIEHKEWIDTQRKCLHFPTDVNGIPVKEIGAFAFADCDADFLLCYGDDTDGKENLAAKYAGENGLNSMEIILSQTPIIHYPAEPYILKPRMGNFFYGDYEDLEEDQWCTWEEDENAPNFGYSDWQWSGCSSWCGVVDFELTAEASSELASANGRYSAEHVLVQNRDAAWVEGVDGYGIGESITYRQSCTTLDNKWKAISPDCLIPKYDGFLRYTEICIVNGYAKDQKTWEENGRIKRLNMYVADKPYACLELADTILPQYFTLPEEDIKVLSGGMIEVRFEIAEVYPGSVYEDTCLTGLVMEFSGRHAH